VIQGLQRHRAHLTEGNVWWYGELLPLELKSCWSQRGLKGGGYECTKDRDTM